MVKVFISYAHKDKRLFDEFRIQLKPMEREGLLEIWHDRKIPPGGEWAEEIDENLEQAQLILLLISADFINSDYCYSLEMTRAIERHDAKECVVVPIIIRPCDWHKSPFAKLNPLPPDERAVTLKSNRDLAWLEVVEGIRTLVTSMAVVDDVGSRRAPGRFFSFISDDQLPEIISVGAPDPRAQFVEPAGAFQAIDEALGLDDAGASERRLVALLGTPGTGKATLAWHYVHSRNKRFPHVIWLDLSTFPPGPGASQMEQAYLELGKACCSHSPASIPDQSRESALQEIKNWLARKSGWLIVFSGMYHPQDAELAAGSLPLDGPSALLLPFAYASPKSVDRTVQIPLLSPQEGALLLFKRSGRLDDAPDLASATWISRSDRKAALELAGDLMLGGLPMAIQAAGAYLEEDAGLPVSEYRNLYVNRDPQVMEYFWQQIEGLREVVNGLFERGDQAEGYECTARQAIQLCAVLSPSPIPWRVFDSPALKTKISTHCNVPLPEVAGLIRAAQKRARDWGILQVSGGDGFFMHVFAQALLTHRMEREERRQAAMNAIIGINDALPEGVPAPDADDDERWHAYNLLMPHVLEYPRLIGLCELEEKKVDPLIRNERIEQVLDARIIAEALQSGDWSQCFVSPKASQEARDAGPNYATFRSMETPHGKAHMLRLLAVLGTLEDRLKIRQSFACMYFLAHYWWDCYFQDQSLESGHIGSPLLEAYRGVQIMDARGVSPTDQEDIILLNALKGFQDAYPPVREYRDRERKQDEWNRIGGVLRTIRSNLNIEPARPDFSSSEKFLRAMTNIYYAEALRYSPETMAVSGLNLAALWEDGSPIWNLYSEAASDFQAIEDSFNENWTFFEESQARLEAAQFFQRQGNANKAHARLVEAQDLAEETIRRAACIEPRRTIDYLDAELIGNGYRVLADARAEAGDRALRDEAWGCHCAATLAAYAFMLSEGDEYSLEFYGEQVDRTIDRVKELRDGSFVGNHTLENVLSFLRDFWYPYWQPASPPTLDETLRSLKSNTPERYLLPPKPDLQSIREPEEGKAEPPYRKKISAVLRAMPGHLSKWRKPALPLPAVLPRVSKKLLEGIVDSSDD